MADTFRPFLCFRFIFKLKALNTLVNQLPAFQAAGIVGAYYDDTLRVVVNQANQP